MDRLLPAAVILAGTAGAAPLLAQGLADSTLTARVSQSIEADTNLGLDPDSRGTSYFADTRLELGLQQDTGAQQFVLGVDTGLRALWEADEDFEFTFASPSTARAGYRQDWATGSVRGDLRYRQSRVDFLEDLAFEEVVIDGEIVELPPDDLNRLERDTTERRYDANFRLDLATDSPSSYSLGFQATRTDYSEEAEDLTERTSLRGDVGWGLRLNPVLASSLRGRFRQDDREDAGDTRIREAGVELGLEYDVSALLSVDASLGYANRTRDETIEVDGVRVRRTTEDDSGPTATVGLRYLIDEVISVSASGRVSAAAPDTRFSGTLRASYALPQGTVDARLSQDYIAAADGNDVRITQANIGFSRPLDALSSVDFDARYALQVNQDQDEPDVTRFDFTAAYSRDISADVVARIGYRFRYRDEDASADSNAVFFTVSRGFETLF